MKVGAYLHHLDILRNCYFALCHAGLILRRSVLFIKCVETFIKEEQCQVDYWANDDVKNVSHVLELAIKLYTKRCRLICLFFCTAFPGKQWRLFCETVGGINVNYHYYIHTPITWWCSRSILSHQMRCAEMIMMLKKEAGADNTFGC